MKLTDINSVLKCRKAHFQEHLNKEFSHHELVKDEFNKNDQPDIPLDQPDIPSQKKRYKEVSVQ